MTVCRTNAADPVIGEGVMLDSLAIAVLGGTYMGGNGIGNVWGVLIGAFILGSVKNLLTLMNVSSYWQYIVTGVIVIVAVVAGSISARKK
jgi:ribose transport system permease protein